MLVDKFNFQQGNTVLLKDEEATKTKILQEFSNITNKAESNDRVLIFFAGHGETEDLPDGGEMGYLLPVDGNKTDLYISSIKMDEIQTISLRSEAKHILYLIDACYGGIATVGARSLDAESTPNYLDKITKYKSRQIISAGGRGEEVIEKAEWGHSAFTKNLLTGLRDSKADTDSDGIITAQELGTYLQKKVTIDSDNRQTPKTRSLSSDEGEFVFVYAENTAVIQDKSTDAKLDYLISEMEELKSQQSSGKNNNSHLIDDNILRYKDEDTKIKIDESGIRIKNDGKSVDINLDGIHVENEIGEKVHISSKALGGAVIGGFVFIIVVIIIVLLIFRKFIIYLFKSLFYLLKKIFRKIIDLLKKE
jgi:hypothetical protein